MGSTSVRHPLPLASLPGTDEALMPIWSFQIHLHPQNDQDLSFVWQSERIMATSPPVMTKGSSDTIPVREQRSADKFSLESHYMPMLFHQRFNSSRFFQ